MRLKRCIFFHLCISFFIGASSAFREKNAEGGDDEAKGTLPLFLGNRPRVLHIFSKPPEPDAPKQTGPNIFGHLGNVIHGGTIGIQLELKPMTGLQGVIDHAKKLIPGAHGRPQVGHPETQKPPSEPYEPPKGDNWESHEEDKDWVPENPEKPVPEGPSWDNIGEDPEDDPSIPYEEIINPRVRPQSRPRRSFLNSKIYRLYNLTFIANGKPFKVKINNLLSKDGEKVKLANLL